MAKKETIRFSFAVGSKFGPRSWKWILTIDGDDLYITASVARRKWKASLHQSGRWHVKALDRPTEKPFIRVHAQDAHPEVRQAGLAIVIPDDCLRPASDVDRASPVDYWLPRPPYEGFLEIVIGTWSLDRDGPEPPLQSFGFNLLFRPTSPTKGVFVAHRAIPVDCPGGQIYTADLRRILAKLPKPVLLDSPERRAAKFFKTEGGAIRIMEIAID